MANINTSWGNVAGWYDELLEEGDDTYQAKVILPNLTRILDIRKGDALLDLASGQGFFSRAFASLGAKVVGVEIGKELVEKARLHKDSSGVTYHVSPSDNLSMIESKSIDKIIIVLALQNIEKMKETLAECSRVLKPKGKLILVLNHPTFRIPKRSSWGYDAENNIQYRRIDGYLSESRNEIEMHPGKKDGLTTVSFHRSLQSYFKALSKAGFMVARLEEWESHKKSETGKRSVAEDRSRKEIPLFMCIEAIAVSPSLS